MILSFGTTEKAITLRKVRLGLTHKIPSYQATGRHPSPRSILE